MSLLQDFDKVDINNVLSELGFQYDINQNGFIHRMRVYNDKLHFKLTTINARLVYRNNNLYVSIICKRPVKVSVSNRESEWDELVWDDDYKEHIKFENVIDADELMLIIEGIKKKVLNIFSNIRGFDHIKIQNYKAKLYKLDLI